MIQQRNPSLIGGSIFADEVVNLTAENVNIARPGGGSGELVGSRWKAMKSTVAVDNVDLGEKKMREGKEDERDGRLEGA